MKERDERRGALTREIQKPQKEARRPLHQILVHLRCNYSSLTPKGQPAILQRYNTPPATNALFHRLQDLGNTTTPTPHPPQPSP